MVVMCPLCRHPLPAIPGQPDENLVRISNLLAEMKKIEAIKNVRDLSIAGLAEAKRYVDCPHTPLPAEATDPNRLEALIGYKSIMDDRLAICPGCLQTLPRIPEAKPGLVTSIRDLLRLGERQKAIQALREALGWDLDRATRYVLCPHVS